MSGRMKKAIAYHIISFFLHSVLLVNLTKYMLYNGATKNLCKMHTYCVKLWERKKNYMLWVSERYMYYSYCILGCIVFCLHSFLVCVCVCFSTFDVINIPFSRTLSWYLTAQPKNHWKPIDRSNECRCKELKKWSLSLHILLCWKNSAKENAQKVREQHKIHRKCAQLHIKSKHFLKDLDSAVDGSLFVN